MRKHWAGLSGLSILIGVAGYTDLRLGIVLLGIALLIIYCLQQARLFDK